MLQNAEILAGIVLSQLVNPGAPVVYGSSSTVTDMRTGSLAIGAPELSMSFQKFLADEEICGMLRRMLEPLEVTEERLNLDTIKSVGIGNEYLTHPNTLAHCRTKFHQSDAMNREDDTTWQEKGGKKMSDRMLEIYEKRLQAYVQPDIDPGIERDLDRYIESRTG